MHTVNAMIKTRKMTPRCYNVSFLSGFAIGADYSKNIRYFEYAEFDSSTESKRTLFDLLLENFEYSHDPTIYLQETKTNLDRSTCFVQGLICCTRRLARFALRRIVKKILSPKCTPDAL